MIKVSDNFKEEIFRYREINNMDIPYRENNSAYANLMFDKETGEVWTDEFASKNSYIDYSDDLSVIFLSSLIKDGGYHFTVDGVKECIEDHFPDTFEFPSDDGRSHYTEGYCLIKCYFELPEGIELNNKNAREYCLDYDAVSTDVNDIYATYEEAFAHISSDKFFPELNEIKEENMGGQASSKVFCFTTMDVEYERFAEYSGDKEDYSDIFENEGNDEIILSHYCRGGNIDGEDVLIARDESLETAIHCENFRNKGKKLNDEIER